MYLVHESHAVGCKMVFWKFGGTLCIFSIVEIKDFSDHFIYFSVNASVAVMFFYTSESD